MASPRIEVRPTAKVDDARQFALRYPHWPGRPSCMTATLKMLALPAAGDGAAWAVLGPCGNRR